MPNFKSSDSDRNSSGHIQPTVAFSTVGCRLNQAETDSVMEQFADRGWVKTAFKEKADLYFINTCTVTGRADRSSRKLIHRARRTNPDATVVAVGCFAASAAKELAEECEVDYVLGVSEKNTPFDFIPEHPHRLIAPEIHISDDSRKTKVAVGNRVSGRSRAFLKIQDGCDHACTYCAVTLVRGKSRSVVWDEISSTMERTLAAGFEEIVITGVDITAWGRDLSGENRDFVDLVYLASDIGFERVRISSLEPWEITEHRIRRLAENPAWCEHFHISLQSAAPDVLNRMKRPTDLDNLKTSIKTLLEVRPKSTIGADIIAGFPGETESDFKKSMDFVSAAPLHYLHVFPYSVRPGTPAAEFDNHLDPKTIARRAEEFRRLSAYQRGNHLHNSIGNLDELLVEHDGRTGYSRGYLRTRLLDETHEPRKRVAIEILSVDKDKDILFARKTK